VCAHFGISISELAQAELLSEYLRLPAFPDVPGALESLGSHGFTLVACSNGTMEAVHGLLSHAGVLGRFSKIISVDAIRTFKPDPAVYEHLVAETGVRESSVWMISSNPFDVIGAKACGLRAVWVQRDPKRVFDPWEFSADLVVRTLDELAGKLGAKPGIS
jgi:2-haloacid dehalogenase